MRKWELSGIADEGASSLEDQLRLHKELGWSSIELRSVDGVNVCEMDDDQFRRVASHVKQEGIEVIAFASAIANWARPVDGPFEKDMEDLRRAIPRMKELGTEYIRIMSYTRGDVSEDNWEKTALMRIEELTRIAEKNRIVLVHENCDGWASSAPERLAKLLETISSPSLKVVFDPGNPTAHGGTPSQIWEFYHAAKERIVHFHIKDNRRTPSGEVEHCYPGEGECELEDLIRDLMNTGYEGVFSIEPHMNFQIHKDPVPGESDARRETYLTYGKKARRIVESAAAPVEIE